MGSTERTKVSGRLTVETLNSRLFLEFKLWTYRLMTVAEKSAKPRLYIKRAINREIVIRNY